MAAGKISIQANDGKVAGVVFEDGAGSNVAITLPKEGGKVAVASTTLAGYGITNAYTKTEVDNAVDVLKDVPQNAKTAAYTLTLTDRGKSIDVSTGGITITVPLNSEVAFPIGTTVSITNLAATAITVSSSATLRQAGTANTGSRTLAAYGMATLRKVATDTWFISGAGVS